MAELVGTLTSGREIYITLIKNLSRNSKKSSINKKTYNDDKD